MRLPGPAFASAVDVATGAVDELVDGVVVDWGESGVVTVPLVPACLVDVCCGGFVTEAGAWCRKNSNHASTHTMAIIPINHSAIHKIRLRTGTLVCSYILILPR